MLFPPAMGRQPVPWRPFRRGLRRLP